MRHLYDNILVTWQRGPGPTYDEVAGVAHPVLGRRLLLLECQDLCDSCGLLSLSERKNGRLVCVDCEVFRGVTA